MSLHAMPVRRGPKIARDGRERLLMFPNKHLGGSRFYALGYADGRSKIGICASPRDRLLQHWVASNGAVTWVHLFAGVVESRLAKSIEREACARAALLGARVRRTETFAGLTRDQVLQCVRAALAAA